MIKLFCSDFDNTLGIRTTIPEVNREGIVRWRKAGGDFAIVTGRLFSNIKALTDGYGIRCHIVASNGALVMRDGETVIHEQGLTGEKLREIITYVRSRGWYFFIYDRDTCYIPKKGHPLLTNAPIRWLLSRILHTNIVKVEDTLETFFARGRVALKVLVFPGAGEVEDARAHFSSDSRLYVTWSSAKRIELMDARVDKWQGILRLAESLGVAPDEIAAIGDYNNDIPMVRASKIGFCVSDGSPDLKAVCDRQVAGVREGGIAEAVTYLLQKNGEEQI